MKITAAAVIASLLSFFIGTVFVFASADMFTQYFYEGRMVALAHVFTLGMMILAVTSRLFPQPHLRHPVQARIRFAGFNVGLIGLSAGLLSNSWWFPIFGSVLATACLWYAISFIPVLREFAQPSDRSTSFLTAAWSCLGAVALLGLWFAVTSSTSVFQVQLQFVYGFVYLFGWVSLMILGMLYRIVPTHVSKLLTARGITGASVRRVFVAPRLQTVVLAER